MGPARLPAAGSCSLHGGGVSEWPKEHASKACEGSRPPRVQIPPPPPAGIDARPVPTDRPGVVHPGLSALPAIAGRPGTLGYPWSRPGGGSDADQPSSLGAPRGRAHVRGNVAADSPRVRTGLGSDARAAYDRLADEAPWPRQQTLRVQLALHVLPGAGVYTALRENGRTIEEAVDAVTGAILVLAKAERRPSRVMLASDLGCRLFIRYLEPAARAGFPPPGREMTLVERSPNLLAFDVTRCYILGHVAPARCRARHRGVLRRGRRHLRRPPPRVALVPYRHARPRSDAVPLLLRTHRARTDAADAPTSGAGHG